MNNRYNMLLLEPSILRLCFIISWLLTIGCVPMVHTFYEPSSEEGRVEQMYCHGQAGPRNTIRFQLHESKIEIYTVEEEQNLLLHISLNILPETVLTFISRDFKVTVQGQTTSIRPSKVNGFNYYRSKDQRSKSEELEKWDVLKGARYDIYDMYLYFPIRDYSNFELQFPPMEVNQKSVTIPLTSFAKTTEFFIDPINC